jgi:hypothetical protein
LFVSVSSPGSANFNEIFDVTINYGNNGPDAASMLVQLAVSGPGTIQAVQGCNISNPPVLIGCPVGTLSPGFSGNLLYRFRVQAGAGTYSFNVSFQTNADTDPVPGNNSGSDSTTVP